MEEYIRSFLKGDLSLSEILEIEGKSLFDFDLPFNSIIHVSCMEKPKTYEFLIEATKYMAGVSSDELDVSYMRSLGFEDYGVVGGPKESEEFRCPKCNKTWSTFDMEEELYDKLIGTMKCPTCDSNLEFIEYYEHVHLKGTKTVRLWKTTVERLIQESKDITEFTEKLLTKLGIY